MSHAHAEVSSVDVDLGAAGRRWVRVAALIGLTGWVASGLIVRQTADGSAAFFHSYLVNFLFFLSLGLGGLFFVLIGHLTRAGWNVVLRRVAEVFSLTLIPLALAAIGVVLGRHSLYEWTHVEAVAADHLLQHKAPFLNTPFFVARLAAYFLVWCLTAYWFTRTSVRQDTSRDPRLTLRMERLSAPAMILYALSVTFAAFDLIMSLYPHWYSTIFGVYYFSGSVMALFSAVALVVGLLQRAGKLRHTVGVAHYHDLGKLMFAFVAFWAYIAFSQFMLIWYAHIPEERVWFHTRQEGPWANLSLVLLFGHFVVPFLWLISRHPKRRRGVLALAAVWLLAMHWFDLHWLVMPEVRPEAPFHLLDFTLAAGLGGLLFAGVFWLLGRVNLVPIGDPRLVESMGMEHV